MTSVACKPTEPKIETTEAVATVEAALETPPSCVRNVNVIDSLGDANPPPACVNNGQCSLRGAFALAVSEAANGCQVVAHVAPASYVINSELTLPRGNLVLIGDHDGETAITTTNPCPLSGDCECATGAPYRIINANGDGTAPLALTLDRITIRGGKNGSSGGSGSASAAGGVVVSKGRLIATRSVIEGNRARGEGAGIGVYDSDLMRLVDTVVRGNINIQAVEDNFDPNDCRPMTTSGGLTGPGGGIRAANVAKVEIVNSAVVNNVGSDAGGFFMTGTGTTLTVQNSTFSGNRAGGVGGGMVVSGPTITRLSFNTFSKNFAGQHPATNPANIRGAAFSISSGQLIAFGNIIAGNGLTLFDPPQIPLPNTSRDCAVGDSVGTVGTVGFNIVGIGGKDCLKLGDPATDPLIGDDASPVDPLLDPLFQTGVSSDVVHALRAGSPALDAYPLDSALPSAAPPCPVIDQRHFARPGISACDLGAYEREGSPVGGPCNSQETSYWCCQESGVDTLTVNVDPALADSEPAGLCTPLSEDANARCSLRSAMQLADRTASHGCKVVANISAGTVAIQSPLNLPGGNLTLRGAGSGSTTITTSKSTCINTPQSCNKLSCSVLATHRLIDARAQFGAPLSLTIEDVTLKGGQDLHSGGDFDAGGGAIVLHDGSLFATRAVFDDNRAFGFGAGISTVRAPQVKLTDTVVRNNINTQVNCNFTGFGGHTGLGGGLFAFDAGSVEIVNSAIVGNVGSQGGGMAVESAGPLLIENSTVSDNVAAGFGGGLLSTAPTRLHFNTISFNISATDNTLNPLDKRGGGITIQGTGSSIAAFGNILSDNRIATGTVANAPDCNIQTSAAVVGANFNLIQSGGRDCIALGDPSDPLIGSNTEFLSPGVDFNLPTTPVTSAAIFHALQTGSPARDAYPASLPTGAPACPGLDQRRQIRPGGTLCDLGAVEVGAVAESDGDGLANNVDTQPTQFSSAFSDVGNSGFTTGSIVNRNGHIVTVRDSAVAAEGVVITVSASGGAAAVQVTACNGTVNVSIAPGTSKVVTCDSPVCVLGETSLDLRDRAHVTANAAAGSFLQIGAPATLTGNGSSGGNALIRQNGVVDGHLVLHGTLSTLGPFTITGTLTQNGNPVIPRLATKSFSVGSGSQTITSNTTLTPGNRGDVTVSGGRTVTFNAGTYNFASLTFDPDANLVANGNVIINVRNNFQFGDRADVINGSGLSLYAGGTLVRLGTDGTFNGVLSAPFANLTVSSRTHVVGCVGGENVTFDTDTTLTRGGRTLPLAP